MKQQYASQFDRMTLQPVPSLVRQLAGPAVVSMMISTIYNLVDTWFVAQLGTEAVAAVGITFAVTEIIASIGYLFGMGSGTCVGMLLGARKNEEASRTGATAFYSSVFLGLMFTLLGLVFLNPLMRFLGSSEAVLPYAAGYGRWILIAFPIMASSLVLSTILRCEGKTRLSMLGIGIGGVMNMVLDPVFIFWLNLGIAGAAMATAVSQTAGLILLLYFFLSGKSEVSLHPKNITLTGKIFRSILVTGTPSLCRHGIRTFATIVLNVSAGMFGGDVLIAALSIVTKVSSFIQSVVKGIYQGAQAVFSYNKGAGLHGRVREAYRFTLAVTTLLILVVAVAMLPLADTVMRLFNAKEETIRTVGAYALIVQTWSLLLMPFNFSGNSLLQSVGESWESSFLAVLPEGLFYMPTLFLLPRLLGQNGIIWACVVAQGLTAGVTLPFILSYFRKTAMLEKQG